MGFTGPRANHLSQKGFLSKVNLYPDGVYLEFPRFETDNDPIPESIVIVEDTKVRIHVNPLGEQVIRWPLRSSIGVVRHRLHQIESEELFDRESHRLLEKYWDQSVRRHGEVRIVDRDSSEGRVMAQVAASWRDDFDYAQASPDSFSAFGVRLLGFRHFYAASVPGGFRHGSASAFGSHWFPSFGFEIKVGPGNSRKLISEAWARISHCLGEHSL